MNRLHSKSPSLLHSSFLQGCVCLFSLSALPAALVAQDTPPEKPVVESATPTAKLKTALASLRDLRGTKGQARRDGLLDIAKRLEAIAGEAADDKTTAARAWYEAGECRRRAEDSENAAKAFRSCLETEVQTYRERALFGLGSMQRRMRKYDEAIANYSACAKVRPDSGRAHEARMWVGRCYESKNSLDQAITTYRDALKATDDPVRDVEASDRLCKVLVRKGDLDGAQKALADTESAVQVVVAAGGRLGKRVQRALERRTGPRALQRAKDARDGAGADAVRLERDRARR